jgi:hypothetical protein
MNEMETKKAIQRINETNNLVLWKINKIDIPLDKLTKRKKKQEEDPN